MSILQTQGIDQYYETFGDPSNPAILLISGLGGTNKSWLTQIERFKHHYYVIAPDHRGTGLSTHTLKGLTTQQLAMDMEALLDYLNLGPVYVVGASTGGAIAQHMVLERPDQIKALILSSTFAKFDNWMKYEFAVRSEMAKAWGSNRKLLLTAFSQYLFSPKFVDSNPEAIADWINLAANNNNASGELDAKISVARIEMIANHDCLAQLKKITTPTLILCGEANVCTPMPNTLLLNKEIKDSQLITFPDCGELIEIEEADRYYEVIDHFIKAKKA